MLLSMLPPRKGLLVTCVSLHLFARELVAAGPKRRRYLEITLVYSQVAFYSID